MRLHPDQQLKWRSACLVLLLLGTAFALGPTLDNGFTEWDDDTHLTGNPRIRELSPAAVFWILSTRNDFSYDQPLAELTFALEYRFFRLDPRIYHLDNLLIHLVNCVLVFYLFLELGGRIPTAFAGALIFGVHPLQVESVAWVAERKNLLAGLFSLATLLSYLKYIGDNRGRSYFLALLFFVISLLAKPMALALPPILFLLDYLRGRRLSFRSAAEKIPFILILILVTVTFNTGFGGDSAGRLVELILEEPLAGGRILARQTTFYFAKLAFPFRLSAVYPQNAIRGDRASLLVRAAPFWMITLTVLVVRSAKFTRKIVFASLFFLVLIGVTFPVTFLYPWGAADRYTYLSAIGIYFLAGTAFSRLFLGGGRARAARKAVLVLALLAAAASLTALSRERSKVWLDSQTLWSDAAAKYPGIFLAHNNLGVILLQRGKTKEAISNYNRALEILPSYATAHFNLGVALARAGDPKGSIEHYRRAVELKPGFVAAHLNLGQILSEQGRLEEAAARYREAIRIDPGNPLAHYNLANTLARRGHIADAVFHYRMALKLRPGYPEARHNLELVLKAAGGGEGDEKFRESETALPRTDRQPDIPRISPSEPPEVMD